MVQLYPAHALGQAHASLERKPLTVIPTEGERPSRINKPFGHRDVTTWYREVGNHLAEGDHAACPTGRPVSNLIDRSADTRTHTAKQMEPIAE